MVERFFNLGGRELDVKTATEDPSAVVCGAQDCLRMLEESAKVWRVGDSILSVFGYRRNPGFLIMPHTNHTVSTVHYLPLASELCRSATGLNGTHPSARISKGSTI